MQQALSDEARARRDHWARLHIAADRRPLISLPDRRREETRLGTPVRFERGGWKG